LISFPVVLHSGARPFCCARCVAQARIEGLEFLDWDENDYAVVDETGSAGFTWSGLVPSSLCRRHLVTLGWRILLTRRRPRSSSATRRSKTGEVRGRNAAGFPAMKSVPPLTAEQRRALARLAAVGRTSPDLQVALRLGPPRRAVALPTRADRLCADFLRAARCAGLLCAVWPCPPTSPGRDVMTSARLPNRRSASSAKRVECSLALRA